MMFFGIFLVRGVIFFKWTLVVLFFTNNENRIFLPEVEQKKVLWLEGMNNAVFAVVLVLSL